MGNRHRVGQHVRNGKIVREHQRTGRGASDENTELSEAGKQAATDAAASFSESAERETEHTERTIRVIQGALEKAHEHDAACKELKERWSAGSTGAGRNAPISAIRRDQFEHAVINGQQAVAQAAVEADHLKYGADPEDVSAVVRCLERAASGWREAAEEIALWSTPSISRHYAEQGVAIGRAQKAAKNVREAVGGVLDEHEPPTIKQIVNAATEIDGIHFLRAEKATDLIIDVHLERGVQLEPSEAVEINDQLVQADELRRIDGMGNHARECAASKAHDIAARVTADSSPFPDEEKHQRAIDAMTEASCGSVLTRGEIRNLAGTAVYGSPLAAADRLYGNKNG